MAYQTPRTWAAGERPTAAQFNQDIRDNQLAAFPLGVAGWTAHAPTISQVGTVTATLTYSKYQRIGRAIFYNFELTITGSGTAGTLVTVTIPVTAAAQAGIKGGGTIFDQSAAVTYAGLWSGASTSSIWFLTDAVAQNAWGQTPSVGLASGDVIRGFVVYEAAS